MASLPTGASRDVQKKLLDDRQIWRTMARHVVDGRVVPKTRSELEALVIGLREVLTEDLTQQALDRLARLEITQPGSGTKWQKMQPEELERLILRRVRGE